MEIAPSTMQSYFIKAIIANYSFLTLMIIAVCVVLVIVYFLRVKVIDSEWLDGVAVPIITALWIFCLICARLISNDCFDKYSYGFLIDGDLKTISHINERESLSSEQLFDLGYVFNRIEHSGYMKCAEVSAIFYLKKNMYLKKVKAVDLNYAISQIYPGYDEN